MKRSAPHAARNLPALGLGLAIFIIVLIATLHSHPYFGNMDDGRLLSLAQSGGPLHFANYLAGGTETGFIRATSMIVVWPTYWLGSIAGPVWFYLANTALVFACLAVFGLAMCRLLGWKSTCLVLCSCQHLCCGRTRQNSSSSQAFPRRG